MKWVRPFCILMLAACFASSTGCDNDPYCPKGTSWCWAQCVDLQTDPKNCGRCDGICGHNSYCQGGNCVCPYGYHFEGSDCVMDDDYCGVPGLTSCDGECVDLNTDTQNCGACGNICGFPNASLDCIDGICEMGPCDDGWDNCNGEESDGCEKSLLTDSDNCGSCGNRCEWYEYCRYGICMHDDCFDSDGDGYCSIETGGNDCDDSDPNVHPDAAEECDGIDNDCDSVTDENPESDESCDDGNECTQDSCGQGTCINNPENGKPCDDGLECSTNDTCHDEVCMGDPPDEDCDGYGSDQCGGDDCDDANRLVSPGMTEDSQVRFVCADGIDNDCDGLTDHDESGCCVPVCTGMECGDGGCVDQPIACGTCEEGYWCNTGTCEEITSELVWTYIPGGTYMMGSDEGFPWERPVHQVSVPSFYMTMTEVTVAQFRDCVESGTCSAPPTWGRCNWDKMGVEDHPVNCVNWSTAVQFCNWAGGRLPSEAEWEYAARSGGKDIKYPWGNQWPNCEVAVFDPRCHEGSCCPIGCEDGDLDGYGEGSGCLGQDCNDSDPTCHAGSCCLNCIDVDGDGYGIGQDCLGSDCDDTEPTFFLDNCGLCFDLDGDFYARGTCLGPDCNESAHFCREGECCGCCIDIDGDGYGIGAGCLGSDCIEDWTWSLILPGCGQDNTWPVCSKPSGNTDQGLCDMAGNLYEWVQDSGHDDYTGAPTDGSAWEDPVSVERVSRSGGFPSQARSMRASNRTWDQMGSEMDIDGFRCARDQ